MEHAFMIAFARHRELGHVARRGNGRAFTLVELLVVIAVIAILVALLLPALSWGKALGQRAVCQNNLRQLALALTMYTDDHSHYPVPTRLIRLRDRGSSARLWNAALLPYVATNLQVFYCPSFPRKYAWTAEASAACYNFPTNIQGNQPFCYAMNQFGVATVGSLGLETSEIGVHDRA